MASSALPPEAVELAVFAKAPVAGRVKTRLAPLLGDAGAAALHAGLVRHTLSVAVQARIGPVSLWCAPDEHDPFFERSASEFGVRLRRQAEGDLGDRMRHAFDEALAAGSALIVVGTDCPVLGVRTLEEARAALRDHDAALAPAEDGGYVLVALRRRVPEIFAGVAWGTGAVMRQTRERLAAAGVAWRELATLWDVDRPADYERMWREGLLEEVLS